MKRSITSVCLFGVLILLMVSAPARAQNQTIPFHLGPGMDSEVYFFSVGTTGAVEVEVRWQGTAPAVQLEMANVAIGQRTGRPALSLMGPSPLRGQVPIQSTELGNWGVGVRISSGTAKGSLTVKPGTVRLSQLQKKVVPMPSLKPEVARFVSLYFYHVDRALRGLQTTAIDRRLASILQAASPQVKDSYRMGLKRYNAIPFETKVAMGYDPQVLRKLQDPTRALSAGELREINRNIFVPAVRRATRAGVPPPPPSPGETTAPQWSMRLQWSRVIAHDETDACFIFCTEAGDDETVAIFIGLDASVSAKVDINQLSENCKLQVLGAALAGDLSLIQAECLKEAKPEVKINRGWAKRTDVYSMNDGTVKTGSLLIVPEKEAQGWQPLRPFALSTEGGIINLTLPVTVVVSLLVELDNGVDRVMDAVRSHVDSLEAVSDELIKDAVIDVAAGASIGYLIGQIGGPIFGIVGLGIGAVIGYAMQPELIGHGEMVFSSFGYKAGGDPEDFTNLLPLQAGSQPIVLREMFTGADSDYELDFNFTARSSALTCRSFDPAKLRLKTEGFWFRKFYIVDETGRKLLKFSKESEALATYNILKFYKINSLCDVGTPSPSMQYGLVSGEPPAGPYAQEDCVPHGPDRLEVKKVGESWKVVEGTHYLLDFGERENEARTALSILKQYGFNRHCFVGRPHASFEYFRK